MHFNKKKIQIKKIKAVPVHYENCLGPINICPKILIIHFMKLFYEKLKKKTIKNNNISYLSSSYKNTS